MSKTYHIHASNLDDRIELEQVVDYVLEGRTLPEIAKRLKTSLPNLSRWLSREDRLKRVNEAREVAAQLWDELAQKMIEDAGNEFELKKAVELAKHFRWRAAICSPRFRPTNVTITTALTAPLVEPPRLYLPDNMRDSNGS